MSLQILNAHTGERATADPVSLNSLDAFKKWLSQATSIPATNQILLTPAGKQAKFQALLTEREVFLYNRQVISGSSASSKAVSTASFKPPTSNLPASPPDTLSDQNDLQAWRKLFDARRAWARDLVDNARSLANIADKHFDAVTVIERGLGVAADNLQNHVRTLETKFREAREWAKQATDEQEEILAALDSTTSHLANLPAKMEFMRFLPKLGAPEESPRRRSSLTNPTLDSFIRPELVKDSTATVQKARASIIDRLGKVESSVQKVSADAGELIKRIENIQAQSIVDSSKAASQLMEEIEVVAKKIASDYEHILTLPTTSKSISQVSKMALLHTRNHLPTLKEYHAEMVELVGNATEQRNAAVPRSMSNMQSIARVEASIAQVNSQLMALDMSTDAETAFDYISVLSQLPFVYGALLIEAVRRGEWSDRLKEESATLAEDIAGYREEEERRRKKWFKNIGHLINEEASITNALNFELNLQAGDHEWPEATRDDISEYLQALRSLSNMEDIVEELSEAAKDLDRPTKRQVKKAKGFKMGSFHEASNLKGSFLLRENDEFRVLKDTNTKLEEELKSQKSRVRKLEDLLYKQSQNTRSNSGNIFQVPDGQRFESPTPDPFISRAESNPSRKSSVTSRPSSTAKTVDDKALARRVVSLEAALHDERQRRQSLESEAQSRTDDHVRIKTEIEESRSTKKDLMENMEAQQREFADERRLLQDQAKESKLKVEELEDELDRILGSRENEKSKNEEKVRSLEVALEDTKSVVGQRDDAQADHRKSLVEIRAHFSTEGPVPDSMAELLEELDELAERSSRQAKDLSYALASSKTDKDALNNALERQEKEFATLKDELAGVEEEITLLRNDSAAEKAKSASLAAELEDGRSQLRTLRAKFAEGETGSEALRLRVEEQASRASSLATELGQAKSHVNSLDVELSRLQRRYQKLQADAAVTSRRLEHRSVLDRELTSKLVATNDELARLLESLGLSIVQNDGSIAIQRTSKLMNQSTSTNLNPPGEQAVAPASTYDVSPEPSVLQWMQGATLEEESTLFTALMEKISSFNLTTFSEAVIKLRRDIERTGKKWKQETRNYREKYHRAQAESHEKIAFRSFKEGDLALFLPTRNQATRPWAAFNVGAPHYFLRETDAHKLQNREWLVARISKVDERVVDLSRTISGGAKASANATGKEGRPASITEASDGGMSIDDDNPFELSDGLRWYLIDAAEEKAGAPSTPGLAKSTVASANVAAQGSIRMKKFEKGNDASGKLNKSLESRRSSSNSKRGSISGIAEDVLAAGGLGQSSTPTHVRPGSRSSATGPNPLTAGSPAGSGPNSLGIDMAPRPIDERSHATATLPVRHEVGSSSPARPSPLGIFGSSSPPKSVWINRAPESSTSTPVKPAPLPSRSATQSPVKPPPGARNANVSPTKTSHQGPRQQSAWESLWSLDVTSSLEGSGFTGKAKK